MSCVGNILLKILLTSALLCASFFSNAQSDLIDSLNHQLSLYTPKKAASDTNRIAIMIELAYEYHKVDPDKGIKIGSDALMASELLNWEKGMAMAGNRIGLNFWAKADYPQSLE